MIFEKDLDESIARYQGEVNPSIETCRKLAACLIVKRELFGNSEQLDERAENAYSYATEPVDTAETIHYDSGTDFSQAIDGRYPEDIWPIMDELMDTIHVLMPRLYDGVMRKLHD